MKVLVSCPIMPMSDRVTSHRGAQAAIYGAMLEEEGHQVDINWSGDIEDHNAYDAIYAYHGNDFQGSLNMFGGVQGCGFGENIRNFSHFKGQVYSLNIDFPNYHEMLGDRITKAQAKGTPVLQSFLDIDLDNLKRIYETAITVKMPHMTNKLVIGDSHSICMYRPGWMVNSVPFKTLNGALKDIESFITMVRPMDEIQELECYFGNIDIRHHLCRLEGDFREHTKDLAKRYIQTLEALPIENISAYELLPIENESRKLPQSGYFQGKPFWGSWEQRNEARLLFRETLESSGSRIKVIRWTDYLLNGNGELDFEHMEKPRSVHLSRASYPHWQGGAKQTKLPARMPV